MKKILLLVEGIADLVFLKDFIEVHFKYKCPADLKIDGKTKDITAIQDKKSLKIIILGSKEALNNKNTAQLILSDINKENYSHKIIILDADDDLESTKNQIKRYTEALELTDNYCFPNNKDTGDLEIILENIQFDLAIADCWSKFENCIDNIKSGYTIPAKKSKIHTYLEILNPNTNQGKENCKERNRDYKNKTIWKLEDIQNPYISNLKTFLDQYLT